MLLSFAYWTATLQRRKACKPEVLHYIRHLWTVVGTFAELSISSIHSLENFSLVFNKKLGKWPRLRLGHFWFWIVSVLPCWKPIGLALVRSGLFGNCFLPLSKEVTVWGQVTRQMDQNSYFLQPSIYHSLWGRQLKIKTTSRLIVFSLSSFVIRILSSCGMQKVCASNDKRHCKNQMHLQSFAKYWSVLHFFYIIHLDDMGLLFMLASQGFSMWECYIN